MARLIHKPEEIAQDHFLLTIEMKETKAKPGHFVNIRAGAGTDPLVRRPFSVFDQDDDFISLVVRKVGRGTELICSMAPGDIDVLGPLGKGFTIEKGGNVLLVGGGVGNAPLYFLAKKLKETGCTVTFIYGAATEKYIYLEDKFKEQSDIFSITTDDGSKGEKGLVTATFCSVCESGTYDRIYTCGPEAMMAAVVRSSPVGTPVEVSMENYFGCGVGLCSGCAVPTGDGYRRACIEGPVMDGREIIWE